MRSGRPSRSAVQVALLLVMRDADPRYDGILPEGTARETLAVLRGAGVVPRWQERMILSRWARRGMDWEEAALLPGISTGLLLRKRYVEEAVRAAIEHGAQQVVVLGAGYDTLCLRLARDGIPVACLEVDHPATQFRKQRGLEALDGGLEPPELVPVDFATTTLDEALRGTRTFVAGARSVFIAEGLLMYLSQEEVRTLLETFRGLVAPGSRLVLTYCHSDDRGRPQLGRFPAFMRMAARLGREPLRWAIQRENLGAFLESSGLRLLDAPSVEDLLERYLGEERCPGLRPRVGEFYAVAEV